MGGAMARGLAGSHRVLAFDPHAVLPEGVTRIERLCEIGSAPDLTIVIAVKPQGFEAVAEELAMLARPGRMIVSIMAGITLDRLSGALGTQAVIVRAMPNLPAAIGQGISAAVSGPGMTSGQRRRASAILAAVGDVVWLSREADMDAVTALSGSGPAYLLRFVEALAAAGGAAGLDADIAMRLARQTFIGTAGLVQADAAARIADLRGQVTSPGGTTAAGLQAMEREIDNLANAAIRAAVARSRDLAS